MRFLFYAFTGVVSVGALAHAGSMMDELPNLDPHGYYLYQHQNAEFRNFLARTGNRNAGDVAVAVHETTHAETIARQSYPLADGSHIPFPLTLAADAGIDSEDYSFSCEGSELPDHSNCQDLTGVSAAKQKNPYFPPSEIGKYLNANWPKVSVYILGRDSTLEGPAVDDSGQSISSVQSFLHFLDEFNAYTVQLSTEIKLVKYSSPDDYDEPIMGSLAFMYFVELYASEAASAHSETWAALNAGAGQRAVRALWTQAERLTNQGCQTYSPIKMERWYAGRICDLKNQAAIAQILGRAPVCPRSCLRENVR